MKSKINISNIFFIFISEGFCFQRFLKRQCSPSIKNWLYLFYFSKTILILEIWWISVEVAFTRETDCFLISSTSLFSANKKKKTPPPPLTPLYMPRGDVEVDDCSWDWGKNPRPSSNSHSILPELTGHLYCLTQNKKYGTQRINFNFKTKRVRDYQ